MKVARQRRGPQVQFEFAVTANHIARSYQLRRRIDRVRIISRAHTGGRRQRPTSEIQGQRNARVKIETLDNRRCDNRQATHFGDKRSYVAGRFLAADSIGRTFKRVVERYLLQPRQRRRPAIEREARRLADANLRIRQRGGLRIHAHVEAIRVIILVDENLRTFFRRNRLLNRVGKNLAKRQTRGDIHVSSRKKTVWKVMYGVDVEARATLIGMLRVFLWSQDAILDRIKSHVEKRARVWSRPEVTTDANAALRKQIAAQSEIRRTTQRQIIRIGDTKTFRP